MRKQNAALAAGWVLCMFCGCGLFDSDAGIRVPLPLQSFDFSVDISMLRQDLQEMFPEYDLSGDMIPEGVDVDMTFPLETTPWQVDLSNEEQIKKYVDADHIKSVTVKFVRYQIDTNTLNYDVPSLTLYVGEYDVADAQQASMVAVTPEIEIGFTGQDEVMFTENGRRVLSNHLLELAFALIGQVDIVIDTSVSRAIPDGLLTGTVQVSMEFTVNPL